MLADGATGMQTEKSRTRVPEVSRSGSLIWTAYETSLFHSEVPENTCNLLLTFFLRDLKQALAFERIGAERAIERIAVLRKDGADSLGQAVLDGLHEVDRPFENE